MNQIIMAENLFILIKSISLNRIIHRDSPVTTAFFWSPRGGRVPQDIVIEINEI